MPTNLPPEYYTVEEKYRNAESTAAKVELLEELISTIPKHKGTDKLRAELRRKLSGLRKDQQKKKGAARHESGYHIEKEGAGRVAVVGAANVGKSALLNALTHARPKVADTPFTTWTPTPGMMEFKDVQIQLIDTPPFNEEFVETELFDLIRSCDLIVLIVDIQATPLQQFETSLKILEAHKLAPLHLRDSYDEAQRMTFKPFCIVVNKVDNHAFDEDFEIFNELLENEWPLIPVSVTQNRNLDRFAEIVFNRLEIIRIYSKPPGKDPDLSRPFVVKKGSTIIELAAKVHKDFYRNLKSARIWGEHVYDGQPVSRDHVLEDGDIVELHI